MTYGWLWYDHARISYRYSCDHRMRKDRYCYVRNGNISHRPCLCDNQQDPQREKSSQVRSIDTSPFSPSRTWSFSESNPYYRLLSHCNIRSFSDISSYHRKNNSSLFYYDHFDISYWDTQSRKTKIKSRYSGFYFFEILLSITLTHFFPVNYFPEILDIFCSCISIVDVVGMFPDITRKKWNIFGCYRRTSTKSRYYIKWSIGFFYEPSPSRTECCKSNFCKFSLKIIEIFPSSIYFFMKFFRWDMIACRCKRLEIKCMIPDLGSIIKNASCWSFCNNLFKSKPFIFRSWNEFIEIIDIGLMMFSIVVLKCFFRNMRSKIIERIWKKRKSKIHIFRLSYRDYRKNRKKCEEIWKNRKKYDSIYLCQPKQRLYIWESEILILEKQYW